MADKPLKPDSQILTGIFPEIHNIALEALIKISNTFKTCNFRLDLASEPRPGWSKSLFIRLVEGAERRLHAVIALQKLARAQLPPSLVPETLHAGSTKDNIGREIQYSVEPYFDGTTTLETIWDDLTPENQEALVDSVVTAIEKLHKLDLHSSDVKQLVHELSNTASSTGKPVIGGPELGYYPDIKEFLIGVLTYGNKPRSGCDILDIDDGIVVRSAFDEIGCVNLSQSDLEDLPNHVVLSHNDLEPRNLLVRQISTAEEDNDGAAHPWYELVAIIDWEMAGMYPFAYEFGVKDTLLGSNNLSFSWYRLFKDRSARLLPAGDCHDKLIQALRIIGMSADRKMGRNIGVRFGAKWIAREQVKLAPDLRRGWIREEGAEGTRPFTKEDSSMLEQEVLRELGYA